MRAKLMRIKTGHASVRDVYVLGECDYEPTVGMPFYMDGQPRCRSERRRRHIQTTPITKVRVVKGAYHFEDRTNSYILEILDDVVRV
jgi:hypothetical protein